MDELFYISAMTKELACLMAEQRGLCRKEWVFLPEKDIEARWKILNGKELSFNRTIGYFYPHERVLIK